MSEAEALARHILEAEDGDVEEFATEWISAHEPRYILRGGMLLDNVGISYDGRIFVAGRQGWEAQDKWVVNVVLTGARINWEEARKLLEAGQDYFGWIEMSVLAARGERRTSWLSNAPLLIRKIQKAT